MRELQLPNALLEGEKLTCHYRVKSRFRVPKGKRRRYLDLARTKTGLLVPCGGEIAGFVPLQHIILKWKPMMSVRLGGYFLCADCLKNLQHVGFSTPPLVEDWEPVYTKYVEKELIESVDGGAWTRAKRRVSFEDPHIPWLPSVVSTTTSTFTLVK
jgi:hypothetical protein